MASEQTHSAPLPPESLRRTIDPARLQAYVDAGARHLVVSPAAAEDTLEIVTLAVHEVLPRLRLPRGRT